MATSHPIVKCLLDDILSSHQADKYVPTRCHYDLPGLNPNALQTYNGSNGSNNLRICLFDSFLTIDLAFGEVRWAGYYHTPLGEYGMAHASSSYNHVRPSPGDYCAGCAIPGYGFQGLAYRIGVMAPKSRTSIGFDAYIQTPEAGEIISYLESFWYLVQRRESDPRDPFFGSWDTAQKGW